METKFTLIQEERNYRDFPDSDAYTVTLIEGELADAVRSYYGISGDVTIHQDGQEGGWSECTVEWDWEVRLLIGNNTVWTNENYEVYAEYQYSQYGLPRHAPRYTNPGDLSTHLFNIMNGGSV